MLTRIKFLRLLPYCPASAPRCSTAFSPSLPVLNNPLCTKSTMTRPSFLTDILLLSVYLFVLAGTETTLAKVQASTSRDKFKMSPFYSRWREFANVTADRIAISNELEAGARVGMKACDNVQCGKMQEKTAFKRCSKCQYSYYCSRVCQQLDWTDGGHRTGCASFRRNRLALSSIQRFTTRERTLMRAILHHDFEALKLDLYRQQVLCLHANPGVDCFVFFDYTRGAVDATVAPPPGIHGVRCA
ncbi:MYND-type domain-containing protein [Mycena venus]|uniref:MYND-type domain-containing protein n=1 Tax=Mycena venus TaxID=2733690 RepID=A0A8H6XD61_9AGAR|nr:MYND-type domain-containing protein [Mycena venus]